MAKRITNADNLTERDFEPSSDEVEQRIQEAMAQVKESIPKSEDLEQNPVEELPIPQEAAHDPRAFAVAHDGDDRKVRISRLNVPAPMQPQHGSRDISGAAAMRLASRKQAERAHLNKTAPNSFDGILHYVECTDSACLGPGIWIKGDPRGELKSEQWWSSYKAAGSYWPPNTHPHCQCCEARSGVRRPLRVDFISMGNPGPEQRRVGLVANQRFLREISQADYEALFQPQELPA